jgi:hypothetical protein
MWSMRQGDRGLPITHEYEYTNSDTLATIRIINVNRYISGRVRLEIFCGSNEIGSKMFEEFKQIAKKVELDLLCSRCSFELPVPNRETTNELRGLVVSLGKLYSIPEDIIHHMDSKIIEYTNVYSHGFHKIKNTTAKLETDDKPIKTKAHGYST